MTVSMLSPKECGPLTKIYTPLVPNGNFFDEMDKSTQNVVALFKSISPDKYDYRYAEGKWTMKEVLQHLIDVERIFAFRALCFARGEKNTLPGFEVDDYARATLAHNRKLEDMIEEYQVTRKSTQLLFKSFDKEMLKRIGTASGTSNSVRALGFRLIGHDWYHCKLIEEKYLKLDKTINK